LELDLASTEAVAERAAKLQEILAIEKQIADQQSNLVLKTYQDQQGHIDTMMQAEKDIANAKWASIQNEGRQVEALEAQKLNLL
jgi:lipopolysaccharide biosynthesis protein